MQIRRWWGGAVCLLILDWFGSSWGVFDVFRVTTGFAAQYLLPQDPKNFTQENWNWVFNYAENSCAAKKQNEKIKAVQLLRTFQREDWGSAFKCLDKNTVTYQLLLRVLEPRLVNQHRLGMCGPATVIMIVAKTDPVAYTKCAVSLFEFGTGSLRLWQLKPDKLILDFDPSGFIPQADWLVLASARNQITDFLVNKSLADQYGRSSLRQRFDWLVNCGFQYGMHLPVNGPPAFHGCDSGHWFLSNRDHKTVLDNIRIANEACDWGGWVVNLRIEGDFISKHGKVVTPKGIPQLQSQPDDPGITRWVDMMNAQAFAPTGVDHSVWLKKCKLFPYGGDDCVDLVLYSWGYKWRLDTVPVKYLVNGWGGINLASDTNPNQKGVTQILALIDRM